MSGNTGRYCQLVKVLPNAAPELCSHPCTAKPREAEYHALYRIGVFAWTPAWVWWCRSHAPRYQNGAAA